MEESSSSSSDSEDEEIVRVDPDINKFAPNQGDEEQPPDEFLGNTQNLKSNIFKFENEENQEDKKLDQEIKRLNLEKEKQEILVVLGDDVNKVSRINQEELMDEQGRYKVFKDKKEEESESTLAKDESTDDELTQESNFKKLKYDNKINILLKALMIERYRNLEYAAKEQVLKTQYTEKVKKIKEIQTENDKLIDQVAKSEITFDKKAEEVNYLVQKHMHDKLKIEGLSEQCKMLQQMLSDKEANQEVNAGQLMEERIQTRVEKMIQQERDIMKHQKRIILEKQKEQENKIA